MNIAKKIKSNVLVILMIIAYIITFIYKSDLVVVGLKNSLYYFKELIIIMPIVLILTALLDFWVPKKIIIKHLGKNAGIRGTFFSFMLGGISAGPIYAAFPICVLLLKKGASIRNVVIVLSSWAVIKVPMLVNEVAFLGPKFMLVRWVLTVFAILVLSYIASKLITEKDIAFESEQSTSVVFIDHTACMGCSLCTKNYPTLFEMYDNKVQVKKVHLTDINTKELNEMIEKCPTNAIHLEQ